MTISICIGIYSILFYSIEFYSIIFHSILLHFILLYSTLRHPSPPWVNKVGICGACPSRRAVPLLCCAVLCCVMLYSTLGHPSPAWVSKVGICGACPPRRAAPLLCCCGLHRSGRVMCQIVGIRLGSICKVFGSKKQ